MTETKSGKGSRLKRIMKAPMRALIKVKDLYIRGMTECSGHFDYATVMGCPAAQVTALPKSFSVSSSSRSSNSTEDFRELVKVASTKSLGSKIEYDSTKKQSPVMTGSPCKFPRSWSAGIGRIDEDKPCDQFGEEVKVMTNLYPRSRSYDVHKRKNF